MIETMRSYGAEAAGTGIPILSGDRGCCDNQRRNESLRNYPEGVPIVGESDCIPSEGAGSRCEANNSHSGSGSAPGAEEIKVKQRP